MSQFVTSNNYVLGRGKLFFSQFPDSVTLEGNGYRFLGNVSAFSQTITNTKVEHYSSTSAVKVKDASVVTQQDTTGSFTTDNISIENMALWFGGDVQTLAQASGGGTVTQNVTAGIGDNYYQLGETAGTPQGVRNVTTVTVTKSSATVANDGTAYTVDTTTGLLHVVKGGPLDGQNFSVSYALAARTAVIVSSTGKQIIGALKFIADNANGANSDFQLPYCKLEANSNFDLIGEQFQAMQFSFEALQRDPNTGRIIINRTTG